MVHVGRRRLSDVSVADVRGLLDLDQALGRRVAGLAADVRADAGDIAYVLKVTNQFFPNAKLRATDVISAWAGLRPLIANPNGKPSDISRSHDIQNPEPGWWDVTGGKLTTYRLMAEQTVDGIVAENKLDARGCVTATEPLLQLGRVEADWVDSSLALVGLALRVAEAQLDAVAGAIAVADAVAEA